tara:strand:- start:2691 stop:3050 length:360 start_codon:yes stop_codon:yes gene_type:complete
MTWQDEIKKKVSVSGGDRKKVAEEVIEKLMEEVDKISDGVLEFLATPNYVFAKRQKFYNRQQIEESLKRKVMNLLDGTEDYEPANSYVKNNLLQGLMQNELFGSVLGDMRYDFEYTRDE